MERGHAGEPGRVVDKRPAVVVVLGRSARPLNRRAALREQTSAIAAKAWTVRLLSVGMNDPTLPGRRRIATWMRDEVGATSPNEDGEREPVGKWCSMKRFEPDRSVR